MKMAAAPNGIFDFSDKVKRSTLSNREAVGVSNTNLPRDIADALERLEEISSLGRDWDSYNSESPSRLAISTARSFIVALNRRNKAAPFFIGPIPDGGIQMEWQGTGGDLEVEIMPAGDSLNYLRITGKGTVNRKSEERHHASIEQVLAQVFLVTGE
jgi:hypothetical protein